MWYVYVIRCNDDKLYTGITTDIKRRLKEHNSGHGGRFTQFRKPVQLVYYLQAKDRSAALKKECEIKKMKRGKKIDMIKSRSNTRQGCSKPGVW